MPYLRCTERRVGRSSKYGKRRYDSPAAVRYDMRCAEAIVTYWCCHCGGWHLTHQIDSRWPVTRFQVIPDRVTLYEGKYTALAAGAA